MAKPGRPPIYNPELYPAQTEKLCRLGATNADLADFFKVAIRTIERWCVEHEEFCRATKRGKEFADDHVEDSLYHRARGYTFDSEKIFQHQGKIIRAQVREHVPPETAACIFWLKNRRKDDWRDKQDHEHTAKGDLATFLAAYSEKPRALMDDEPATNGDARAAG
jgi:hypothetical protein